MITKLICRLIGLSLLTTAAQAQSDVPARATDENILEEIKSLNLPCLEITTTDGSDPTFEIVYPPEGCIGESIRNNENVEGRVVMTLGADTLYDSGEYKEDQQGMRVRVRGNTSATARPLYPSLKIKLEKKADLLLRDDQKFRDKNWALLNSMTSVSLKAPVGFQVGLWAGLTWEPALTFVNVVLNGRYWGLYLLTETVKNSEARYQVSASGYIMESDPYWWNTDEPVINTEGLPYAFAYTFKYPDGKEVSEELIERFANLIRNFENTLMTNGDVAEYIDLESFAAWMVAHDVLGTKDGAGSNVFICKEDYDPAAPTSTKLKMGPLWDLDSDYQTPGQWAGAHTTGDFYTPRLFTREDFVEAYRARWEELREGLYDKVMHIADSIAATYGAAVNRSRELTTEVTGNPYQSMEENVAEVENWFSERITWMDNAVKELAPTVGVTHAVAEGTPIRAEVYDLGGKRCATFTLSAARDAKTLAQRQLQPGIYVLRFLTADGGPGSAEKIVVR